MKTKLKLFAALLLLSTLNPQPSTFAQGTAFTYQGRLNDGASGANGTYDVRFAIYDALTLGTQQGPILTNSATDVSNGLFTVTLDFGNQFPGTNRWLALSVRTNGAVGFAPLTPRQPITATPYAVTAGNLAGTLSSANLSGAYANAVTLNNAANNLSGNGAGLTGLNAANLTGAIPPASLTSVPSGSLTGTVPDARLSANVAMLAGSQTFTGVKSFSSPVTIANPGDLSFGATTRQMINVWSTNYGIGVQNGTLYSRSDGGFAWFNKGVHANSTFDPGVGGTNLMWLDSIGDLYANASVTVDAPNANNGSYYPGLVFGYNSGEAISSQRGTNGSNRYGLDFYTGFQRRLSIANNGNVGIGTASPDRPLAVQANAGSELMSLKDNAGANRWHLNLQNGGLNFAQSAVADGRLFLATNGNVGLGTLAPAATLDVAGTIRARSGGIIFPDGSVQTHAAEGSTSPTTASGYAAGTTVSVTLNGSPCSLAGPLTIHGSVTFQGTLHGSPLGHATVRVQRVRPVGVSDWANGFANVSIQGSSPSNPTNWFTLVVTVIQPGGASQTLTTSNLLFKRYAFRGKDGQLLEEADLVAQNNSTTALSRSGAISSSAPSADIPGLSVLNNGTAMPGVTLANLDIDTALSFFGGTDAGAVNSLLVTDLSNTMTLRANLSAGAGLVSWLAVRVPYPIAVQKSGVTLVGANEAIGSDYRLLLADDGLPIEELDLTYRGLTAP